MKTSRTILSFILAVSFSAMAETPVEKQPEALPTEAFTAPVFVPAAVSTDWLTLETQARVALAKAFASGDAKVIAQCTTNLETIAKGRFLSGQADLADTLRIPLKELQPQLAMVVPGFKAFFTEMVRAEADKENSVIDPGIASAISNAINAKEGDISFFGPLLGKAAAHMAQADEISNSVYEEGFEKLSFDEKMRSRRILRDAALRKLITGSGFKEAKKLALAELAAQGSTAVNLPPGAR